MTAGSFAFGWALVPLYDVLCKAAGIGNAEAKAGKAVVQEAVDPNREVTIEFMAEPASVGSFDFRPKVASMRVHPGKLYDDRLLCQEFDQRGVGRAGRSQHLAHRHGEVFPQDGMFLLQSAEIRRRRGAGIAGALHRRSRLAAQRGQAHLAYTFYDTTQSATRR